VKHSGEYEIKGLSETKENGIIVYFAYSEKLRGYIDEEWIK
jgi:hypothetical protein